MRARLAQTRQYTLAILKTTAKTFTDEGRPIIWEHGRRNMALQDAGELSIVCPVTDGGAVAGIGIFARSLDEVKEIMDGDPAVAGGVLTYELHAARGFPGASLSG
jgi:hypothetical protein